MRTASFVAASALLGFSFASSLPRHGHQELHNKRHDALLERNDAQLSQNTSCGCTTIWTTFYGEPTLIQPAEPETTSTILPTVAQPITHPITNTPESPTPKSSPTSIASKPAPPPPPQAPAPKAAAQPKKPVAKPPTSHASSPLGTTGSQWAMTYSPYTPSGNCKSTSDITTDVISIASKGFSSIRIYSTDCNGLSAVSTAASPHSLNLILGVYISDSGIGAARPQIEEIVSWASSGGSWAAVEMIVVGNEAVFNGFCTAEALASFVAEARSAFQAAGYSGPVTTTETIDILQQHSSTLCPAMDIAAANIHPFFNGQISAQEAGKFVADQLSLLEGEICPGKEARNLETGWPKKGSGNGKAVPGRWEQEVAVMGIKSEAGGKSAFFSFVDDEWKGEGEWGVERNFGCGGLFG